MVDKAESINNQIMQCRGSARCFMWKCATLRVRGRAQRRKSLAVPHEGCRKAASRLVRLPRQWDGAVPACMQAPDCGLWAAQDKAGQGDERLQEPHGRAGGPRPGCCRLKPEDLAQVGSAPLQKGKFTWVTESGREERWIVASCGNYTLLWNFRCAAFSCAGLSQHPALAMSPH